MFYLILNTFLLCLYVCPCCAFTEDVSQLSVEEKVGQTFMAFFKGENVNDEAKKLIETAHLGNIIYYKWANGLHNPDQVKQLSKDLQQLALKQRHAIPLLIAVDQEGGRVNRLTHGFTIFPSNGEIAQTHPPEYAETVALAIGNELRAVGINMNLAPVVDINSNPLRTVLNTRAFGSTPEVVTQYGQNALKGYQKAHILATLKHFPGYGEAAVDPHLDLPVVDKPKSAIESVELYPFRVLAPQAGAIMTAHIVMPALDSEHCATLSKKIVQGILRDQWHYQGLIVSDSLVMGGVLNESKSIEEVAVRAFEAGHDILVFGGKLLGQKDAKDLEADDIIRIHRYLVEAVKSGRISEKRLNESVQRILKAKKAYAF